MQVKICGLRSRGDLAAAAEAGATWGGLVFYPPSPRHVSLADARWIAAGRPEGLQLVALTVDATDAEIEAILEALPVDMLQLHGAESPERVAEVRARFGLPVMKAVGVAEEGDLDGLAAYAEVVDMVLVDARPPEGAELPGGNGVAFDWRLIRDMEWPAPWVLAGGLTPENVADAIRLTGAERVDVSSGVEKARGIKDRARMEAFVRAALAAGEGA
ncbi:phosphoribosylanthranilate isomerase [Amaricoccus sp.]|uniref:phosphoribosylanthranilate isomerase n=1 Tax=Amaricoccus sp. TaxID=1872485 RepID=UPI001B529ADE|nr:phosphoribosylanthranilate isomerase [Amaricoccus sp.]MBP7241157.1 phosphoribosylanthranilate isomerase [Amaricoccus sp.]